MGVKAAPRGSPASWLKLRGDFQAGERPHLKTQGGGHLRNAIFDCPLASTYMYPHVHVYPYTDRQTDRLTRMHVHSHTYFQMKVKKEKKKVRFYSPTAPYPCQAVTGLEVGLPSF